MAALAWRENLLLPNGGAKLRITVPPTVATATAVLGILIVTIPERRRSTVATYSGNTLSASIPI